MKEAGLRNDRGSAMVLCLMMLVAMTMIGTLFMVKTNTETQIAGNDTRSTQAFFNAEAGYGEVLARMSDPLDVANYIGPVQGDWLVNPGWGRYVVSANGKSSGDPNRAAIATDATDNDGNGVVDETGETYAEVVTKQTGSTAINYPWVKVRYRRNAGGAVILFGNHDANLATPPVANLVNGFPIILVSAEGDLGTAMRRVEVEAVKFPFETINAAIYSEDDNFKFNGTSFLVSGEDHDPVTEWPIPGNPEVPAIVTTQDPDNISAELHGNQANNLIGLGAEPSVADAAFDLDLEALRDAFAPQRDILLAGGTYSNTTWGGLDDYKLVHCTGDLHTSGQCVGGGLLIVDGDLTCSGQFLWYGLVIVLGNINFTGGGSGIHVLGGVYVQGGIQQVVGGQADVFYCSQTLANLAAFMPYVVSSWREL